MPLYEYACECGGKLTEYKPLKEASNPVTCLCGQVMGKVFGVPQIFVAAEVSYECPVTGIPITSKRAHEENLAKHGCRVYETGEKEEVSRRKAADDLKLEEALSETAAEFVDSLPSEAREQLGRELESGLDVTVIRQ